jgi:hypothetical protein
VRWFAVCAVFVMLAVAGCGKGSTVTVVRTVRSSHGARPLTGHNFTTPSRNILCEYFSNSLRCDLESGLRPYPPKSGCHAHDGIDAAWTGLAISRGVATPACSSDAIDLGTPLAYGRMWKGGDVVCLSRVGGLICVSRTGHGFFLSRDRWLIF